jgi:hypothetical protein
VRAKNKPDRENERRSHRFDAPEKVLVVSGFSRTPIVVSGFSRTL